MAITKAVQGQWVAVGPLLPGEWPWVLARSVENGWGQMTPAQRALAQPEVVRRQIETMVVQALAHPGATVLVARQGGTPVGYLMVSVMPDELTGAPMGLFLDIWVEPEWRGQGVARRLTGAGEAHLRALGVGTVRRVIVAHNTPSLRHALADGCWVERLVLTKEIGPTGR